MDILPLAVHMGVAIPPPPPPPTCGGGGDGNRRHVSSCPWFAFVIRE